MKILITGGAGFIGSNTCKYLLDQGHEVTAYDNLSLGKEELLLPCRDFKGFRFVKADLLADPKLAQLTGEHELVIHLAANSDISQGSEQTDLDLKVGTIATYNVLEAMRISKVKKIVFASTSAIYGEATQKPTPESYGPLMPISFYGASKLSCEAIISAFTSIYDIEAWIFRFANIVGKHLTHGAIYDFMNRLVANPKELNVLGNGLQKKSYLHVSDCISGILFGLAHAKNKLNYFNLASEGVTEVRFIAEEVVRQLKLNTQIKYGTTEWGWKGDVPYTWLDGAKLGALGWQARLNSNQAVSLSIEESIQGAASKGVLP